MAKDKTPKQNLKGVNRALRRMRGQLAKSQPATPGDSTKQHSDQVRKTNRLLHEREMYKEQLDQQNRNQDDSGDGK